MSLLSKVRRALGLSNGNSIWREKTAHSDEYFKKWAKQFAIGDSLDYYVGRQWRGQSGFAYDPYTINLIYSTIKLKRPSLLFDKPVYHFLPKPSPDFTHFDFESAAKRCLLKQDALNNWVGNKHNYFREETKQAIVDAFFGFGIIETGYSATWIENPDAPKPAYDNIDDPGRMTTKPPELPASERVYVKRIPFPQFRVGGIDSPILERNNWCGYFEYVDRRDLANAKGYDYKADFTGNRSSELDALQKPFGASSDFARLQFELSKGDLVKIWKIYDNRSKHYLVYAEDLDDIIFADEFDNQPFRRLAFDDNIYGFYPIPPVSQWLSSQDEINECSEQLRVHRRRANRRYMVSSEADELELTKVLNGPDGVFGRFDGPLESMIFPVPQAPMDQANQQAFIQSKDNFNVVSQTNSALRGEVDRQTATAATISNQQAQITDSEPKTLVADWLVGIGEDVLEKLSISVIPFWVRRSRSSQDLGTSVKQPQQFDKISGQDLEGQDYEVNVKLSSLSPIDASVELQSFQTFLGLLNSNPEFALSPLLIRELAVQCNYTNEEVIEEFQKIATLKVMGLQQQGGQTGGDPSQQGANGAAQAGNNAAQNAAPSNPQDIAQQINGQVQ
jgi:hypothetical protein